MLRHGELIYIYNNIYTNQVIYSLTRGLSENKALKQLTFVGKKSVPTQIRPDLWRPLACVRFPSRPQGLSAYRKLREFRKMHEFCWEPEPGKPAPPKRERIKMLMDQKANSVADLAAVLKIQEGVGAHLQELRTREGERKMRLAAKVQERYVQLASLAEQGGLEKIEAQVKRLETIYERAVSEDRKTALRDQIRACRRKIIAMRIARKRVAAVEKDSSDQMERDAEHSQLLVNKASSLESYRPEVTVEGVIIEWADPTDKDYAVDWPNGVFHDIWEPNSTEKRITLPNTASVEGSPIESGLKEEVPRTGSAGFMGIMRNMVGKIQGR